MEPITADSFSAIAIFQHADLVVKAVMIGLAIASLWSWAIIIEKALRFRTLNKDADAFDGQSGYDRVQRDSNLDTNYAGIEEWLS